MQTLTERDKAGSNAPVPMKSALAVQLVWDTVFLLIDTDLGHVVYQCYTPQLALQISLLALLSE